MKSLFKLSDWLFVACDAILQNVISTLEFMLQGENIWKRNMRRERQN